MPKPHRNVLAITLVTVVASLFSVSSIVFAVQGGFGAGHAPLDLVLFILGLPWLLIPWPGSFGINSYAMVVLVPATCNAAVALCLWVLFKQKR